MIANLFAPIAMKISAGIIAAMLLALGLLWWQNGRLEAQRDKAVQAAANCTAAHAVTKASLDNLALREAGYIADGERRAKAAREALQAQEARSAALGDQIARLRAVRASLGTVAPVPGCETPAAITGAAGL